MASAATFRPLLGLYVGNGYSSHIFGVYLKKHPKTLTATCFDLFALVPYYAKCWQFPCARTLADPPVPFQGRGVLGLPPLFCAISSGLPNFGSRRQLWLVEDVHRSLLTLDEEVIVRRPRKLPACLWCYHTREGKRGCRVMEFRILTFSYWTTGLFVPTVMFISKQFLMKF